MTETTAETKVKSPFAQAIFDLMITPGIISMEEWCEYIDPYVEHKTEHGTTWTYGPEAKGAPKTMMLIQSWFDDQALPNSQQLGIILSACENGNLTALMTHISAGMPKDDPGFENYVERYKKGHEQQTEALKKMHEVLNGFAYEVTPLDRECFDAKIYHTRLCGILFEERLRTLWPTFLSIPGEHRDSVMYKLFQIVREAEANNWYEDSK